MQRLRTEHEVDVGCARDDRTAFLTRDAAAHADDQARPRALEVLHAPQIGEHLLLRLLAHRAGVEEDEVGVLRALAALVAVGGGEHVGHAVRVVLVHLAPEGADVDALRHLRVGGTADQFVERVGWSADGGGSPNFCGVGGSNFGSTCSTGRPWTPAGEKRSFSSVVRIHARWSSPDLSSWYFTVESLGTAAGSKSRLFWPRIGPPGASFVSRPSSERTFSRTCDMYASGASSGSVRSVTVCAATVPPTRARAPRPSNTRIRIACEERVRVARILAGAPQADCHFPAGRPEKWRRVRALDRRAW